MSLYIRKWYLIILVFCICISLSSCASRYFETDPAAYAYKTANHSNEVEYYIIKDVLQKAGNSKYARKERRKKVAMIALKVVNHSDAPIFFTPNKVEVISGHNQVKLITPEDFYKKIRQRKGWYLLYALLNVSYTTVDVSGSRPEFKRHFYPIGTPIAVGNFLVAHFANQKLKNDLIEKSLLGDALKPGDEVYGYIYLDSSVTDNLILNFKE